MDMIVEPVTAEVSPKRRQIVAAAEILFLAHGYGAVSMDAIAKAASVSKATLYAHFASKDALFAGIMAEKGSDNPIDDSLFEPAPADIAATLTRIGQSVLHFMLRERTLNIYRVVIAESGRFPELGEVFFTNGPQRFCDRFTGWLAEQASAGRLTAPDLDLAAQQFMALLRSGLFIRASLALKPAPTDTQIDATVVSAVSTFLKAFGPAA
jgi:TetR/AcrR family transcriptional regulator, mexJK operon transcriptional repressor